MEDERLEVVTDLLRLWQRGEDLSRLDERKSRAVELHSFGGLTYDETASALGVSVAIVNRELRAAKAWPADETKASGL